MTTPDWSAMSAVLPRLDATLERAASAAAGAESTAQPEIAEERVVEATGRGWDEWIALIEEGPGRDAGHPAIASWLADHLGVDPWWAQMVTVSYERLAGLRLPGQMPDGTFTVSRSRTLAAAPGTFREALLTDRDRALLLPGLGSTLRSKETAKTLRFDVLALASGESLGRVAFAADASGDERTRLTVTHERLATHGAGEAWKDFWAAWLTVADEVVSTASPGTA